MTTTMNDDISATPFGQLPILEMEGGVTLGQSYAIARYLARKFGKY